MSEPQRLAIRSPNWLGDAIMALPAMGAIRRAYPDAHIAIAAPSSIAPLFREDTNAQQDSVLTLTDRRGEREALAGAALDAVLLFPTRFDPRGRRARPESASAGDSPRACGGRS